MRSPLVSICKTSSSVLLLLICCSVFCFPVGVRAEEKLTELTVEMFNELAKGKTWIELIVSHDFHGGLMEVRAVSGRAPMKGVNRHPRSGRSYPVEIIITGKRTMPERLRLEVTFRVDDWDGSWTTFTLPTAIASRINNMWFHSIGDSLTVSGDFGTHGAKDVMGISGFPRMEIDSVKLEGGNLVALNDKWGRSIIFRGISELKKANMILAAPRGFVGPKDEGVIIGDPESRGLIVTEAMINRGSSGNRHSLQKLAIERRLDEVYKDARNQEFDYGQLAADLSGCAEAYLLQR